MVSLLPHLLPSVDTVPITRTTYYVTQVSYVYVFAQKKRGEPDGSPRIGLLMEGMSVPSADARLCHPRYRWLASRRRQPCRARPGC